MKIPGLTLRVLWGLSSSQFARDWLNQFLKEKTSNQRSIISLPRKMNWHMPSCDTSRSGTLRLQGTQKIPCSYRGVHQIPKCQVNGLLSSLYGCKHVDPSRVAFLRKLIAVKMLFLGSLLCSKHRKACKRALFPRPYRKTPHFMWHTNNWHDTDRSYFALVILTRLLIFSAGRRYYP